VVVGELEDEKVFEQITVVHGWKADRLLPCGCLSVPYHGHERG
jgi:hypothetical protein